ncbi:PD-(D/E)XK nuclease family protein [Anabaena cylindrica UHCC 0172]|uniref:PD-(D/E)XK nuclease family protein n=1 Tax=Anabaena cylindrica TaxID=1165 RepID=UPI002B1E9DEE|nr:PD-(D/E)XK nuclease family protein [Anabaena cylindrica]MEA5550409.1 PD-(D/E)XK nuclease family protein [Anabaena cylindrica UHCC 0172]
MSLFTKLLKLHSDKKPCEDFFTIIVAHFLDLNQDILIAWLKDHSIINKDNYLSIRISTQKSHKGLPIHTEDSRIDIQVELSNGRDTDLIFIESKIGAKDVNNNLEKYAHILSNSQNIRHRILIYITRDDDPKNKIKTFASNLSPQVSFYELRWYQFYDALNKYEFDPLKIEILKFMEDNQMFQKKQFSDNDLLSMKNFNKAIKLIDKTFNETDTCIFKTEFIENFTDGTKTKKAFKMQPKIDRAYTIRKELESRNFRCELGYFHLAEDILPKDTHLGVYLGVHRKYSNFESCCKSMKTISEDKQNKWILDNKLSIWRAISYTKSLQEILSDKDHLSAIQKHFLHCIEELKDIRKEYPDLPWSDLKS